MEEVKLPESVPQSQIVDSHEAPLFAVVLGPSPNNHDTIQTSPMIHLWRSYLALHEKFAQTKPDRYYLYLKDDDNFIASL